MQSLLNAVRFKDLEAPTIDLPDIDLSKIDVTTLEMPKVDLAKAVAGAAAAVGLSRPGRPRWQYALGAVVVVATAGFVAMNASTIRDRVSVGRRWVADRARDLREGDLDHEPVAFTAEETQSAEASPIDPVPGSSLAGYPEGPSATTDARGSNGRSAVASPR